MWEEKIKNYKELSYGDSFNLAKEISIYINSEDKNFQHKGRELLIKALDNQSKLHPACKDIFNSLVSAVGFYPYLNRVDLQYKDFGEQFRAAHHKSEYLKDKYFHSEQKKLYDLLIKKRML